MSARISSLVCGGSVTLLLLALSKVTLLLLLKLFLSPPAPFGIRFVSSVKARKERQQPQKITEYSYEDIDKRANIAKHYLKHIGELASDFPSREDVECLFQFQPVEMQKDFAETCDKAMQTIRTVKLYYTERVNKYPIRTSASSSASPSIRASSRFCWRTSSASSSFSMALISALTAVNFSWVEFC